MLDVQAAGIDDALARSVIYRTLSLGFQMPTDERLDQIGARDGFPILAAALDRFARTDQPLVDAAAVRLRALTVPSVGVLTDSHVRLFGHTTRGLVCACETEYGPDSGFHQPQQLADICGYYLAFGLQPVVASDTRPDHIACECEFMDFLNRKQAVLLAEESRSADGQDTLEVTERAERTFLRDHLGRFGRAFAARISSADHGYFGVLGRVLLAFIDAECARVGVGPGPIELVVRPDAVDETPMLCGTADELIQIQRSR